MKINRLIEITTILLNKKTVTASDLAARFNVSTRTIYRDIDVLSSAGVPVYSTQGINGGISIMDDYTLNRSAISKSESENIIFALQTLQATKYPELETILEKLGAIFKNSATDWVSIDFSPWGSNPNDLNKFDIIKYSILKKKIVSLDYINARNIKTNREIAPLRLIFKSQAWYLFGYCYKRSDYRTFRISRIRNVVVTEKDYERSRLIRLTTNGNENKKEKYKFTHLVLEFTENALHRLYDDYDDEMIIKNSDGTYTVEFDFPEDDWVYGYILGFGENVKVISPPHIQEIIKDKCNKILSHYNFIENKAK